MRQWLLGQALALSQFMSDGNFIAKIMQVSRTTHGALASIVVIGLYMATVPSVYTECCIRESSIRIWTVHFAKF
jgi:hypothetical protein